MNAANLELEEEEIDLADLQRAVLDEATVDALLADIDGLCELEAIALKSAPDAHADARAPSVKDVRPALERGAAVQLRYVYRGERWCDTLLPGMSGTLLVRVRERAVTR